MEQRLRKKGVPLCILFKSININKHGKYIIPFRRDSFIVSFGTDKDFGNEKEYLDWVKTKSNEFPDGFVLVFKDETPIYVF